MPGWFIQLGAATQSLPIGKSLIMLLAFGLVGFFMMWKSQQRDPLTIAVKLIVGFTIVRISGSYWTYNRPFLEGVWPILWPAFGLLCAYVSYSFGRKTERHAIHTP